MNRSLLAIVAWGAFAAAACKTADNASVKAQEGEMPSSQINAQGEDGDIILRSLQDAGVRDAVKAAGAMNLQASFVSCYAPVVPQPKATCYVNSTKNKVKDQDLADGLYAVLRRHNAQVKTNPPRIGAVEVAATDIHCSRAVVPNAKASCYFAIGQSASFYDTTLTPDGTGEQAMSGAVTSAEGDDGEAIMRALTSVGVSDKMRAAGATNIFATTVVCSGAQSVPQCQVTFDGKTLPVKIDVKALYNVIAAQSQASGGQVAIKQVQCSRAVYPNAKARCQFTVD